MNPNKLRTTRQAKPKRHRANVLPSDLTKDGLNRAGNGIGPNMETVKKLTDFINANLCKTKAINKRISSYGLKHDLELAIGEYATNGELIAAMILCGYSIERIGPKNGNCYFNVSQKSVNKARPTTYGK